MVTCAQAIEIMELSVLKQLNKHIFSFYELEIQEPFADQFTAQGLSALGCSHEVDQSHSHPEGLTGGWRRSLMSRWLTIWYLLVEVEGASFSTMWATGCRSRHNMAADFPVGNQKREPAEAVPCMSQSYQRSQVTIQPVPLKGEIHFTFWRRMLRN